MMVAKTHECGAQDILQDTLEETAPTVLVVEDDRLVMSVITEALADDHFRVLAAPDAAAARRVLESDAVDVLFTDIDLGPGPSGLDLAREARRLCPGLAVVYASGGRPSVPKDLAVPGATFVPKPYRQAEVCDLLSRIARRPGNATM
jgi:DNA-binding response OmpR family regulator